MKTLEDEFEPSHPTIDEDAYDEEEDEYKNDWERNSECKCDSWQRDLVVKQKIQFEI